MLCSWTARARSRLPAPQACEIAGLAAGAQQVVAIVYQAAAAGTVTVPAVLYTHQSDVNHANNQVATQIVVN